MSTAALRPCLHQTLVKRGARLNFTAARAVSRTLLLKTYSKTSSLPAMAVTQHYFFSTAPAPSGEKKPKNNAEKWRALAEKELRGKRTVESLQVATPEGIMMQPVYWDLNNTETAEMPGVYPFTRGPYATMYTNRKWTIRQVCSTSSCCSFH